MIKGKLQEFALLAEIISAITIIISLIFVGLQVRQTNTLAETDSLMESTQIWAAEYRRAFGTKESSAFMRKAMNGYDDLSKDERGVFFSNIIGFVGAFDNLHNRYESGLLREETYLTIAMAYYKIISTPGAKSVLMENVSAFPPYLSDFSVNEALVGKEEEINNNLSFLNN